MKALLFLHSAGPQGPREGSGVLLAGLRKALGKPYRIRAPKMPRPDNPDYPPWKAAVAKEIARLRDGDVLVGHSLGGSVLLKYLSEEECGLRFSALFLAATPFWGLPGWEYEGFALRRGFARHLPKMGRIALYHALDDDVVARSHALRYRKSLPGAELREVDGMGHAFDGGECGELLEDLRASA